MSGGATLVDPGGEPGGSAPRTWAGRRLLCTMIGVGVVGLLTFGAGVLVAQAVRTRDGDEMAAGRVHAAAQSLGYELGRPTEALDAETIAAEEFAGPADATIKPLSWTGTTEQGNHAQIDVRISASVDANTIGGYYGPFNSAGSAAACYRYTLVILEETAFAEIPCESVVAAAEPPRSHRPALPSDAAERIDAVLPELSEGDAVASCGSCFPLTT